MPAASGTPRVPSAGLLEACGRPILSDETNEPLSLEGSCAKRYCVAGKGCAAVGIVRALPLTARAGVAMGMDDHAGGEPVAHDPQTRVVAHHQHLEFDAASGVGPRQFLIAAVNCGGCIDLGGGRFERWWLSQPGLCWWCRLCDLLLRRSMWPP